MARNTVSVEQIVNDFMLTLDGDDYANNANGMLVRNYALRGIREMNFDIQKKVKSLLLTVDTAKDTVDLPDDFVDYIKIGAVGFDGLIYVFGENKNISAALKYKTDSAGNNVDSDNDGVFDREDAKQEASRASSTSNIQDYEFRIFISRVYWSCIWCRRR